MNELRVHYPIALPPSRDYSKRDEDWKYRNAQAVGYIWGRMDMGEYRNASDILKFADLYADRYWEFDHGHGRPFMPALQHALRLFDAGEVF